MMPTKKLTKLKWKVIRKIADILGFEIYDPTVTWLHDERFNAVRRHLIPGIPDDRCYVLFNAAQGISPLSGDIAECGSRKGKSARFILEGLGDLSQRTFHIFDSFEGLSKPAQQDRKVSGDTVWKSGDLATSQDVLLNNLDRFRNTISIRKGWIPERFSDVHERHFVFVHIDVDLYQPTRDSLEFFYDRMVPGGVIICDDYGSSSCPGAKKAFDEFFADRPEVLFHLPTAQALIVKR